MPLLQKPAWIDNDFDSFLRKKIWEDNTRPLLPELPKPDLDLLRVKKKFVQDDQGEFILEPPSAWGDAVTEFAPPYGWLHNDYPITIVAMGFRFACVSDAFNHAKNKLSPTDPDWDLATQFTVMRMLIEKKFTESDDMRFMLLGTKKRHLEFVNDSDELWGTNRNKPNPAMITDITGTMYQGKNELGKMLMQTRDLIRVDQAGISRIVE